MGNDHCVQVATPPVPARLQLRCSQLVLPGRLQLH